MGGWGLVSPSTSRTAGASQTIGAFSMIKQHLAQAWRFAVTVGPLVAVALALTAGIKWR